ncbi:39S ribosomal protein L23, mitochondrial [Plecturocebus cupreus]
MLPASMLGTGRPPGQAHRSLQGLSLGLPWPTCVTWTQSFLCRYPLYQLGGPQLRVFRTNFFIQLVRPGTAQPEDTVQFRIPMEMTRVDLRNYLERIYNVPVAAVRTRVQHGSNNKRDRRNVRIKKPDYKVAYVQLVRASRPPPPGLPGAPCDCVLGGVCAADTQTQGPREPLRGQISGPRCRGRLPVRSCSLMALGVLVVAREHAHGQTFTFPDLFPEKEQSPEGSAADDLQRLLKENMERRQNSDPRRGGVTDWFGL